VRAVDLDLHFVKQFLNLKILLVDTLLHDVRDGCALLQGESGDCLLGESVGFKGGESVVRFLGVVDDHYCVLELLGHANELGQNAYGEAEAHASRAVEPDLVGVHKSLRITLHGLLQLLHLRVIGAGHGLGHEERVGCLADVLLGDAHKESVSVDIGFAAVLDHVEESGCVEDNAAEVSSLVDFVSGVGHNC